MGFRLDNFLATAAHVFDELAAETWGLPLQRKEGEVAYIAVDLPKRTDRLYFYSKSTDLDLVLFELPLCLCASSCVCKANLAKSKGVSVSLFGINNRTPCSANGPICGRVNDGPLRLKHKAATAPFFSGSPLLHNNKAVGIHLGARDNYNVCLALNALYTILGLTKPPIVPAFQMESSL
eukprot:GHVN01004985.1.p1 GENE.GHVN01004985.1~~GHVN01004985.1.p1  ORF type:complete len:196 (-),score=25.43 GHVN01004985.1:1014-1550(-)